MENIEKPLDNFLSSGNERLDKQLLFTAEIDKMTSILRRTLLVDGSRRENDAEHSWHLAVMAQLFSEYAIEAPDVARVAKMVVIHDLVEIYAGDTFAFDKAGNVGKAQREEQAAEKLFSQLPSDQGQEICDLWHEFDAMQTADAKFANCLDRIQPFLHNTLTGGHTWLEGSATESDVLKRMNPIRLYMNGIWPWVESNIQRGLQQGWIIKS